MKNKLNKEEIENKPFVDFEDLPKCKFSYKIGKRKKSKRVSPFNNNWG